MTSMQAISSRRLRGVARARSCAVRSEQASKKRGGLGVRLSFRSHVRPEASIRVSPKWPTSRLPEGWMRPECDQSNMRQYDKRRAMAGKSENRSSEKASARQARRRRANRDQVSEGSNYRQKGRANRDQASEASGYRQKVKQANQDQASDASDYRQRVEADKLAEASKKGSCAPKLFMLLLPFAALGTYVFLTS